ncbi:fungal specific transcription factor domain containing protein [Rutstroemia sp. NJR-2017a BVV2]|nr:fungal specific transcription factor domain containing protein [Rutstroemia sp. NJR-2017a BVV2]
MESRRRLGKRRMAHVSDTQPSILDGATFWGSSWGTGQTQWQWKPPSPSLQGTSASEKAGNMLDWLMKWIYKPAQPPDDFADTLGSIEDAHDTKEQEMGVESDVEDFCSAIKSCTPVDAIRLCDSFNQKFQRHLTLGLVCSSLLSRTLQNVSLALRMASQQEQGINTARRLLMFYSSVWEGILSCKVMRPIDFDSKVIGEFISLLAEIPSSIELHNLTSKVLASVSSTQLEATLGNIELLIKSSIMRLAWQPAHIHRYQGFKDAEISIKTVQQSIRRVKFLTMSHKFVNLPEARHALSKAFEDLNAACAAIVNAEDTLQPALYIKSMVAVLALLPKSLLPKLATSCSNFLNQKDFLEEELSSPLVLRPMREGRHVACFDWLLILSRLEKMDDVTFTSIWNMLESYSLGQLNPQAESSHFTTAVEIAELSLSRWITQGHVVKGLAVEHTFRTMNVLGRTPFLNLFRSLQKHEELHDEMFRTFFDLLYKLQKPRHSFAALHQLRRYASRVDVRTVAKIVRRMDLNNRRMAYQIYMHYCKGRIKPESCVSLIVAMINSDNISSRSIWAALEIPIWAELPEHRKHPCRKKSLSKSRINLIHKMATAFSVSKVRSPRVALRNVTQCWQYLSAHGVEPMPEMSKAIVYLGVTRDIEEYNWVSTDRFRWVFDVVAKCEGQEVADEMDRAVYKWRQHLVQESDARFREANVLGTGHLI